MRSTLGFTLYHAVKPDSIFLGLKLVEIETSQFHLNLTLRRTEARNVLLQEGNFLWLSGLEGVLVLSSREFRRHDFSLISN
jgi:hypothetical protein